MNECMYTHMMDDLMINDLMMDDLMVDGQMTLKKKEEGPMSDIRILAHLICSPCGISWADSVHCYC